MQSKDGFKKFVEKYPTLSSECYNIYAIPTKESLIDFQTYKSIMMSSGLEFNEVNIPTWAKNVDGCISTKERVINTKVACEYFKTKLGSNLVLNQEIDYLQHTNFDYVIDCTWGHFNPTEDTFFEPTLILLYKEKYSCYNVGFPAFTLVDGPLCSLYKTENNGIYTLSSVPHTPLGQVKTSKEAHNIVNNYPYKSLDAKRFLIEEQIQRYIPDFNDYFEFYVPQFSIKTKPYGAYDDRSCHVSKKDDVITVMSGKIDTIFTAMDRVLYYIGS
jgi:hypothetical protein